MSSSGADSKPASRLKAVASLLSSPPDAWLAVRTLGWMCALPLLKRMLPLPKLVRLMWLPPRTTQRDPDREQRTIRIVSHVSRVSGGNCLERSIVLYRYLSQMHADPRLVIGMAKPDVYLGHVWVKMDGQLLLETSETLLGYEEVTAFGDQGERVA